MLLLPQAPTTPPFLVYISVELTLTGACLLTWLAARSRTLFLSLSAYSFLIAVQLIFQLRGQSNWAHAALDLTAPMIVILASQVMHIWEGRWARLWMGALWLVAVLCLLGTLLGWSWIPYDLPINLTEAMLLVQIARIPITSSDETRSRASGSRGQMLSRFSQLCPLSLLPFSKAHLATNVAISA